MKPSEMKKDTTFSGRINKEVKKDLYARGVSIQKIIDEYIDKQYRIEKRMKRNSMKIKEMEKKGQAKG